MPAVAYRSCSLCEAMCGLELEVEDPTTVSRIRGDRQDVLSAGYLCPKGGSLHQLHADPDRLRAPLVRGDDGALREASWDAAFRRVDELLAPIIAAEGTQPIAVYVGNPAGFDLSATLYHRELHMALGGRNLYTVGSIDNLPKSLSCGLMFGNQYVVPVPDVDRTQHLIILGANPALSNGSMIVAPDMRGRMKAIQERGGKVVVFDPRLTRTAATADEHHFIRPGTDAALLLAVVHVLFDESLVALGHLEAHVNGVEELEELAAGLSPEMAAPVCGVAAQEIRRVARELATTPRAVVYGRTGTTMQAFGTLSSWLIDVVNVLIGALDSPGGAMFGTPPAEGVTTSSAGAGRGVRMGRWSTRVSGRPEVLGELPIACLGEEIATPGPGRVRALITLAGNPVLSAPGGRGLDEALPGLDALICNDFYVNETTRHADVILPPASPLERPHYPLYFGPNTIRNTANYSPPTLPLPDGRPADWEITMRLAAIVAGQGPDADVAAMDDAMARGAVQRRVGDPHSAIHGRDVDEVLAHLGARAGPERMLDLLLRCGPYGDAVGARSGLTLAELEATPHGRDFGPLVPRLPGILRTPSGRIELVPPLLRADVVRLVEALPEMDARQLLLIGRRETRSMNSWLHNLPNMAKGGERCALMMHPVDAEGAGLADGARVIVTSRAGAVELELAVTDDVMPGVVSAPHGWGHERTDTRQHRAAEIPGSNANRLAAPDALDGPSGTAAFNGIPVSVRAA